jgi:hypothetical protein
MMSRDREADKKQSRIMNKQSSADDSFSIEELAWTSNCFDVIDIAWIFEN